jgi:DNA invertase Pin-like site-specific DNA recombinase
MNTQAGIKVIKEIRPIAPPGRNNNNIRVAAYCRVSSNSEDQLESYSAQVKYYTEFIDENPDWELIDIYADEGLTGTASEKRSDFNRLIADCKRGKIDQVIVKSVSRFARNTQDCLHFSRLLKRSGVTIYFEKENLCTSAMKDEFSLTMHGMAAQDESISISKNVKWGYKKRMERGEFITNIAPCGYRMENGKLVAEECEADLIRRIFGMYLSGIGKQSIANILNAEGVCRKHEKNIWYMSTITYILTNEKYIGDALVQKFYTEEALPFRMKRNNGEREQYYIESNHEAVVTREIFEKTQKLLERKKGANSKIATEHLLSQRIFCPDCGYPFRWHLVRGVAYWMCSRRAGGRTDCAGIHIAEQSVLDTYLVMLNKLIMNGKDILTPLISQLAQMQMRTSGNYHKVYAIDKEIAELNTENMVIAKLHGSGILDFSEYTVKAGNINAKVSGLRKERRMLISEDENEEIISELKDIREMLSAYSEIVTELDDELFSDIVIRITAAADGTIRFKLRGGLELTERIY